MEAAAETQDLVTCNRASVNLLIFSFNMNNVTFSSTKWAHFVAASTLLSHLLLFVSHNCIYFKNFLTFDLNHYTTHKFGDKCVKILYHFIQ
jgi:hypothetical protein